MGGLKSWHACARLQGFPIRHIYGLHFMLYVNPWKMINHSKLIIVYPNSRFKPLNMLCDIKNAYKQKSMCFGVYWSNLQVGVKVDGLNGMILCFIMFKSSKPSGFKYTCCSICRLLLIKCIFSFVPYLVFTMLVQLLSFMFVSTWCIG